MHTNVLTGKSYVGFTSGSLAARWRQHRWDAKHDAENKCVYFHRAMLKYGEHCWLHSVLETCLTMDEARASERRWIAELETNKTGYNVTSGGDGAPDLPQASKERIWEGQRRSWTPERKKRQSEMSKRQMTPEAIARLQAAQRAHVLTDEQRAKIDAARARGERHPNWGKHLSAETRAKIGAATHLSQAPERKKRQGEIAKRNMTEEARKHLSEVNKGKKLTAEHRAKLGHRGEKHPFWGKHLSAETRAKIGAAHRGEKSAQYGKLAQNRKITLDDEMEILRRYEAGGVLHRELGEEYNVTKTCIRLAILRAKRRMGR
jgi:group I intron endonuclease